MKNIAPPLRSSLTACSRNRNSMLGIGRDPPMNILRVGDHPFSDRLAAGEWARSGRPRMSVGMRVKKSKAPNDRGSDRGFPTTPFRDNDAAPGAFKPRFPSRRQTDSVAVSGAIMRTYPHHNRGVPGLRPPAVAV
jgi:hypothetical protein